VKLNHIYSLLGRTQGESGGGACATTAVVKGGHLYVAHVGDCRAVLSRDGAAAALTADHTCAREEERERIEREGGYVSHGGEREFLVIVSDGLRGQSQQQEAVDAVSDSPGTGRRRAGSSWTWHGAGRAGTTSPSWSLTSGGLYGD